MPAMASLQCRQRRSKAKTGWLVVADVDRPLIPDDPSPRFEEPADHPPSPPSSFCLSPKLSSPCATWKEQELPESWTDPAEELSSSEAKPLLPSLAGLPAALSSPGLPKKPSLTRPKATIPRCPKVSNLAPLAIPGASAEPQRCEVPSAGRAEETDLDCCYGPPDASLLSPRSGVDDPTLDADLEPMRPLQLPLKSMSQTHSSASSPSLGSYSPGPEEAAAEPSPELALPVAETRAAAPDHSPLVSAQELCLLANPVLTPLCPTPPLDSPASGSPLLSPLPSPVSADAPDSCVPLSECLRCSSHDSGNSSTLSLSPKLSSSSCSSSSSLPDSLPWTPSSGSPPPGSPSASSPSGGKLESGSKNAPMLAVDLFFQQQHQKNLALQDHVSLLEQQVTSLKEELTSALEDVAAKEVSLLEMQSQVANMATAARFWQEEAARLWRHQCSQGKQRAAPDSPAACASTAALSVELRDSQDCTFPSEAPAAEAQPVPPPAAEAAEEGQSADLLQFLEGRAAAACEAECEKRTTAAGAAEENPSTGAAEESHFALAAEYRQWMSMSRAREDEAPPRHCIVVVDEPLGLPEEGDLSAPCTLQPELPLSLEPEDQQHLSAQDASIPQRTSALLLASVLEGPSAHGCGMASILDQSLDDHSYDEQSESEEEFEDEGAQVGMKLLSWVLRPLLGKEMLGSVV